MATEVFAGPVDFAVFALPQEAEVTVSLGILLEKAHSGALEILDLEVIGCSADGTAVRHPFAVLNHGEDFDFSVFDGAESDLLDAEDLAEIASAISEDELALVIVYEDRSLAGFADSLVNLNGRELFSGGIPIADLEQALESEFKEN